MVDVDKLSDAELRTKLLEYGFPVMPITGTTRKVMAKKLKMLLENKNKIVNEGGRRSLGRYSSEEESDSEIKVTKKKDNRRATMAAPIMQPPTSSVKVRKSTRLNESPEREISSSPTKRELKTSTTTTTSRTQKIIQASQDEFDTGSDSESDIVTNNYLSSRAETEYRSPPVKPLIETSFSSKYSPPKSVESSYITTRNVSFNHASPSRTYNSPSVASEYASDRLNQIRSRLSLGSSAYDKPISYTSSPVEKEETPFLSNFTKRLSALSSNQKREYDYKNDIIKEHDTNGSSIYARNQIGRANRGRETTYEKINRNNILKNNFVSFAVLAGAALFFIFLAIMYLGMKSDTTVIPSGTVIPHCILDKPTSKKGVNCLVDEDIANAVNLYNVLQPELQKRAIANKCFDPTIKAHMTETEIINYCIANYAIDKEEIIRYDLNNLEILTFHNPEWGLRVVQSDNNNGQVLEEEIVKKMEQVIFNRDRKVTSIVIFNPELPWKCTFYNTFYIFINGVLICALIFGLLYVCNLGIKYYRYYEQKEKEEIGFMVEKIIDILQSNVTEDGADNYVVINHVRDMILPIADRQKKERTWAKAVKFIELKESRIRPDVQVVRGEPFEVWRWIGSTNLSMSGDRSDYNYQPGRRIVDVQYLITEVLKFPHKRLRFCNNSDVEIQSEVREGFRSILLLYCKGCKKEHPVCSEEPESELMNVNLALVAGIISLKLGLHHLHELCSSLRIPMISAKDYNIYLDEIFEIYNESMTESEKSTDTLFEKRILRSSTPKATIEDDSKKEAFLNSLKKSDSEIEDLSLATINQKDNALWFEERKKRLTASNFGRICKLLDSTDRKKVAYELLNSHFSGNIYTQYGSDNEVNAIKAFENISKQKVERCGLYIHPQYPFLAATPDGLVENGIIEIKCPYKARNHTPEEAINQKLIMFATYENGIFTLKRNDKYYFQVQGQLFVTGREVCYFIVWTPHGLLYEKILKDKPHWDKMLPKLEEFYFNHMLPMILSNN